MNDVGTGCRISSKVENAFRQRYDTAKLPMPFHRTSQLVKLRVHHQRVRQEADQVAAGGKQVEADIQEKCIAVAVAQPEKFTRLRNFLEWEREGRIRENPMNPTAKISQLGIGVVKIETRKRQTVMRRC